MNYLQYIHSFDQGIPGTADLHFLVSGADGLVRQAVGESLLRTCRAGGKTLILVDNIQGEEMPTASFGWGPVTDIRSGKVSLCPNLLDVSTLTGSLRLRGFLSDLGMDGLSSMKVVAYIQFVKETERRLGNMAPLTVEKLEEYSGTMLVRWKLEQLVEQGMIDEADRDCLLGRYAEVSAAAADFEMVLPLVGPLLKGSPLAGETALRIPLGAFSCDPSVQKFLGRLTLDYVRGNAARCFLLLVDDGKSTGREVFLHILKNLPPATAVHLFSADIFSLEESALNVVMGTFPVRIYTRHENMASAEKIQARCGQMDVVYKSKAVTVDKRLRANSPWDLLLGNNRTETQTRNTPVKEYRFRKEKIAALAPGTGIVDYRGSQVLFSF